MGSFLESIMIHCSWVYLFAVFTFNKMAGTLFELLNSALNNPIKTIEWRAQGDSITMHVHSF